MDKENRLKKVHQIAMEIFPELQVSINDLTHPTEAFLTKTLSHSLRALGFRVEPPINADSGTSREKRQFLSKLCFQTERIMQIAIPTQTYTYWDIINPTSSKTVITLELVLNFGCYYKKFEKEVFGMVKEPIKQREELCAQIADKNRELEQRKNSVVQQKEDIENCRADIDKFRAELKPAQEELRKQQKIVLQQKNELETLETQFNEISNQVNHWQQLIVEESKAQALKNELQQVAANIESYKTELAHQSQIFMERGSEIDANKALCKQIEEMRELLSRHILAEYTEKLKLMEHTEKQFALQVAKQKQQQLADERKKQSLEQTIQEFQTCKEEHEQEGQAMHRMMYEKKALFDEEVKNAEQLAESYRLLKERFEAQVARAKFLEESVNELFGDH